MTKKTTSLFYIIFGLLSILLIQSVYLYQTKSISKSQLDKKSQFLQIVGLPDLAISTEATYVRHRSISDIFSIYKDDGVLREYFPSTFTYSHSGIINDKK